MAPIILAPTRLPTYQLTFLGTDGTKGRRAVSHFHLAAATSSVTPRNRTYPFSETVYNS